MQNDWKEVHLVKPPLQNNPKSPCHLTRLYAQPGGRWGRCQEPQTELGREKKRRGKIGSVSVSESKVGLIWWIYRTFNSKMRYSTFEKCPMMLCTVIKLLVHWHIREHWKLEDNLRIHFREKECCTSIIYTVRIHRKWKFISGKRDECLIVTGCELDQIYYSVDKK